LATIKEKRTLDNAKKTFAYTTNLEDWRRFIAAINELALSRYLQIINVTILDIKTSYRKNYEKKTYLF
jgi:hypothetical protein